MPDPRSARFGYPERRTGALNRHHSHVYCVFVFFFPGLVLIMFYNVIETYLTYSVPFYIRPKSLTSSTLYIGKKKKSIGLMDFFNKIKYSCMYTSTVRFWDYKSSLRFVCTRSIGFILSANSQKMPSNRITR